MLRKPFELTVSCTHRPQVRLLGGGGLDATVQPDTAAAVVDALWLSADHESPQVGPSAAAGLLVFGAALHSPDSILP